MANTIKLDTNVPVTGTVTQVWYQKSTKTDQNGKPWPDQIKLVGSWDGKGDGNIYLNLALESQMQQKGIIGARAGDAFPVLGQNVRIQVMKKEEGGNKFVDVALLSGGGGAPRQNAGTNISNGSSSGAQGAAPANQQRIEPKLHWQKLQLTMKSCIETGRLLLSAVYNPDAKVAQQALSQESIQLCANELFRERCRHALLSSPPAPLADQAAKDAIAQQCIKLGQDEVFLKSELLKQGVTDIAKMTAPEGEKVKAAFDALIAAKEAAEKAAQGQGTMYPPANAEDIPF